MSIHVFNMKLRQPAYPLIVIYNLYNVEMSSIEG
jgi:hypothetical protein